MPQRNLGLLRFVLKCFCGLLIPALAWSQTAVPQNRVVQPVDENTLVTMRGNTHPLAQRQFDRGAAPPDLPMSRMLLVLKRSAEQEAALEKLLDDQQDVNSPSYHQWLTPDQFGQQFGPSDQDVQTISAWLRSHGFQVAAPSRGRTVIEFSGTAAQVQQAFRTEIHKFTVNAEDHWANASDPQIPAGLAPVVTGISTLYNFPRQQMHELAGRVSRANAGGALNPVGPFFTFPSPCSVNSQPFCNFAISPADFAKIYNVPNLLNPPPAPATPFNGDGVTIAIVGESQINTNDVTQFRGFFGLPALTAQQVNVIVNGPDPGTNGAETEADLDVELAGSVAPNATIDLVIAQPTEVSLGVDLAAQYAVDNNLAPVLNESFGVCEFFMGTTNNAFYNQLWQQAAAQGISVFVSSGDSGSAVCDGNLGSNGPAKLGLSVNGVSSTPYNVSVGGTDFNDVNDPLTFWNTSNSPGTLESAKGYIPEVPWNDTCTNPELPALVGLPASTTAEQMCNDTSVTSQFPFLLDPIGGSGGKSGCTTSDFNPATGSGTLSSCGGGYAKPSWQTALTPNDGKRDLPDVSLFASDGFNASFYAICQADAPPQAVVGACGTAQLVGIGGTSASSPAFAAIMALINQAKGSRQGNPNYILYKLAAQGGHTCTSAANPASTCVFYDIPSGFTIAMPCAPGKPNCSVASSADTVGVLSGYPTSSGYDLATGLGSVNAANLIKNWKNFPLTASTVTAFTLTPPSGSTLTTLTHGQSVGVNIKVAPQVGSGPPTPSGNVSLIANTGVNGTEGVQGFTLSGGDVSSSTNSLPGGSYTVFAQYAGDGTFSSSVFSPAVPVIVSPEASQPNILLELFDPTTGAQTNANAATATYGSLELLRMNVTSKAGDACAQNAPGATGCPTGSVTITNNGAPLDAGTYALNSQGYAEDQTVQLPGGANNLALSYPGDNSFTGGNGNAAITITPAPTQISGLSVDPPTPVVGIAVLAIGATVSATKAFAGTFPSGTISFYDGATPIGGTVNYIPQVGTSDSPASLNAYTTTTFTTIGTHQITAKYSGDSNYQPSSSSVSVSPVYLTSGMATANPSTVFFGQSLTVTATMTGASKTPPMTGTFNFTGPFPSLNPVTPAQGTDASGNQTLTASVTVTPQNSGIIYIFYTGDGNYSGAEPTTNVTVNIPDFSLNVPASPFLITAGQPGNLQITVVPATNVASTVMLSCGGQAGGQVPGGYTCAISPTSVNLNNGMSATATLSLTPSLSGFSTATRQALMPHLGGPFLKPSGLLGGMVLLSGIIALSFVVWPVQWLTQRQKAGILFFGLICLAVGCGSAGGGGGGGSGPPPTPQPTTTAVMTSAGKVAWSAPVAFTATITGSNHPTGAVSFYLNGVVYGQANLVGNTAVWNTEGPAPGIYVLTAAYSGDALNNPSTSTGVNLVATGSSNIGIMGQTSSDTHSYPVVYTIQ